MFFRTASIPRRYRRHFLIFLISLALVIMYHIQEAIFKPRLEYMISYKGEDLGIRNPKVSCKFPLPHPMDPSILSHIRVARPIVCSNRNKLLLQIDNNGYLCWNETDLNLNGYLVDNPGISCTYQEIWRPERDDFNVMYGEKILFNGTKVKLTSDYVYVSCLNWLGFRLYEDYLAKTQKLENIRRYKKDELDLIVIGLDSVSRLNFMRQLPKAYKLLTRKLGAVVLVGFNKVGKNTFPNVVPMLTGRPLNDSLNRYKDWPFIWKDFANAGAVTMYAEDQPHINMFDYYKEGIDEQPTHHYMHTFWLAAEYSFLRKSSYRYCLGAKTKHSVYFTYLKSFLQEYSGHPKFLFSLFNEPSHNFINTLGVIDDVFTQFINSSYYEGLFSRSVVVILGDHGNRMDTIRSTELGKIEDSMPMVSFILPNWINETWIKSLKRNSNRLTSTYDLYATFVDVLGTLGGTPGKPGTADKGVWDHFSKRPLGQSLFQEVPLGRTCEDAGIPEQFCVCRQDHEKLNVNDQLVERACNFIVKHINKILKNIPLCSTLSLDKVHRAVKSKNTKLLHISLSTTPGNGLFEIYVSNKNNDFQIHDIQRINPYGTQANCLSKEVIGNNSLYQIMCYCK